MWIFKHIKRIRVAAQTVRRLQRDGYAILFPHKMGKTLDKRDMDAVLAGVQASFPDILCFPQFVTDTDRVIRDNSKVMITFFGVTPEMLWHAVRLFYFDVKLSKNPPEVVEEYWAIAESIRIILINQHDAVIPALEKPESTR